MSSWINYANAGSLRILSWKTPALISRSSSSAVRFARSRHERTAASASSSAPGVNDRWCAVAVAVALASMIVPIALHELIDLEDHDPHFQARSNREEHDSVFTREASFPQVLPQGDEMRRRRRVADLVDGHDDVLGRATQSLGELLHSLLDRPRGGLMGDEIVDLVELEPGLIERLA